MKAILLLLSLCSLSLSAEENWVLGAKLTNEGANITKEEGKTILSELSLKSCNVQLLTTYLNDRKQIRLTLPGRVFIADSYAFSIDESGNCLIKLKNGISIIK